MPWASSRRRASATTRSRVSACRLLRFASLRTRRESLLVAMGATVYCRTYAVHIQGQNRFYNSLPGLGPGLIELVAAFSDSASQNDFGRLRQPSAEEVAP